MMISVTLLMILMMAMQSAFVEFTIYLLLGY